MIHRTESFAALFIFTLGLIALIEYGCRKLPHIGWELSTSSNQPTLKLRQESSNADTTGPTSKISVSTTYVPLPSSTIAGAYLDPTTKTLIPSLPATSYLDSATETVVFSLPATSYLDPATETVVPSLPAISYLDPTTRTLFPSLPATSYLDPGSSTETTSYSAAIARYLNPATSTGTTIYTSSLIPTSTVLPAHPSGEMTPLEADRPLFFLSPARYFYGAYLAVFLAVIFRVTFGWLYAATKMLEPFYLLTQPEGTPAQDFFNINYLSTNDSFEPYKAMLSGHWLMLWTSLLYTFVGLASPFASELLRFYPSCENNSSGERICAAAMWINPTIARILQVILSVTFIMLAIIWWLLGRLSSGVYSDPSSIASMMSLLHHPATMEGFRHLNQWTSKKETVKTLADKCYRLKSYQEPEGPNYYGVVATRGCASEEGGDLYRPLPNIKSEYQEESSANDAFPPLLAQSRKPFQIIRDVVFVLVTVGILILVAVYYINSADNGFERFFDSQSFGPRFLITFVGVIIHSQWERLEREISVNEPFSRLLSGHATPESTILVSRSLIPVTSFFTALYRRSFFVAHIAFVAITAEVLIIVLPGIPFNSAQLFRAFIVSAYLAMAILALMLLTLLAVWLRPKGPALPRKPNTLGAMCLYLCDSRTRFEFRGFAFMETKERNRIVRDMGKGYEMRYEKGGDGTGRWKVDYEIREDGEGLMPDR